MIIYRPDSRRENQSVVCWRNYRGEKIRLETDDFVCGTEHDRCLCDNNAISDWTAGATPDEVQATALRQKTSIMVTSHRK